MPNWPLYYLKVKYLTHFSPPIAARITLALINTESLTPLDRAKKAFLLVKSQLKPEIF